MNEEEQSAQRQGGEEAATREIEAHISPAFWGLHGRIERGAVTEAILKGGRGSTKSSFASIEVMRQIHKMSMVPDLTDVQFAANTSGVAMRYKMLGLEQMTAIKERWFREGLRCRLRLFASFLRVLGVCRIDAERVQMTFTRSLPVNESEAAAMVAQLNGVVPKRILFSQLPFVDDVDGALEELNEENRVPRPVMRGEERRDTDEETV